MFPATSSFENRRNHDAIGGGESRCIGHNTAWAGILARVASMNAGTGIAQVEAFARTAQGHKIVLANRAMQALHGMVKP